MSAVRAFEENGQRSFRIQPGPEKDEKRIGRKSGEREKGKVW